MTRLGAALIACAFTLNLVAAASRYALAAVLVLAVAGTAILIAGPGQPCRCRCAPRSGRRTVDPDRRVPAAAVVDRITGELPRVDPRVDPRVELLTHGHRA